MSSEELEQMPANTISALSGHALPCPATMLPRCEEQVRLYMIAATRAGRVGRWETAWGGSSRHAVPVILFRLWPSPWPCGLWSFVDADWRVSRTAHASEVLCCPS